MRKLASVQVINKIEPKIKDIDKFLETNPNDFGSFDFEIHNKKFRYYCEVVVFPDGSIEYAVPSHQEKLISIYMNKTGKTRIQCEDEWIKDTYWLDKVRKELGIIYVWYNHYDADCVDITYEQLQTLHLLNFYGCTELKNEKGELL